jgi:cytochrome b561
MNNNKDVIKVYARPSKRLHWVIAMMFITLLCVGICMGSLPEQLQPRVYFVHKSLGLLVLILMLLRLIVITYFGRPQLPTVVPVWERRVSRAVQYSLYLLLFAMPISGWIMSTASGHTPIALPGIPLNEALSQQADLVHCVLAWVISICVCAHIAFGVRHFYRRDTVFQRMWF